MKYGEMQTTGNKEHAEEKERHRFTAMDIKTLPYQFEPTKPIASNSENIDRVVEDERNLQCGLCSCENYHLEAGSVCCWATSRMRNKMGDRKCITEVNGFKILCLDDSVLWVAFLHMNALRKQRHKLLTNIFNNKARLMWVAYGQFMFWIYEEPLGHNIRKIWPLCVYSKIHQSFPLVDGMYSDFCIGANTNIYID